MSTESQLMETDEPITRHLEDEPEVGPASGWARLAVAVGIVLMGVFVLWQGLQVRGDLRPSGPKLYPVTLGCLWLLLAASHLVQVLRAVRKGDGESTEQVGHLAKLGLLVLVLVGYAYTIYPLGYLLSTVALFVLCAWILGSSRVALNVVVAVLLTVVVYFVFTRFLGISLPQGVIPL